MGGGFWHRSLERILGAVCASYILRMIASVTNVFHGNSCMPEEAKWRIMQWCVDGLTIPNKPGGKEEHMRIQPRDYQLIDLLPLAELDSWIVDMNQTPGASSSSRDSANS